MERKRYLRAVVTSLKKKIDKENLLHLGHFAYDKRNHSVLLELNIIDLLQSYFDSTDTKLIELALGTLCNLSSNPLVHKYLEIPRIISQWNKVSVHGKRSIACILFYTSHKAEGLVTDDKVTLNILNCL